MSRHVGVQHAQTARRGITWIHKHLLATFQRKAIHLGEAGERHKNFAANLQNTGCAVRQGFRDRLDGANVCRHVLAPHTIASRSRAFILAAAVDDCDRQAIEFGFRHEIQLALNAQPLVNAAVEGAHIVIAERIFQRQHRHFVDDGPEGFHRSARDALGGRVGGDQLRELRFELPQFDHQLVVLGVRDFRIVEFVVALVVAGNLPPELQYAIPHLGFGPLVGVALHGVSSDSWWAAAWTWPRGPSSSRISTIRPGVNGLPRSSCRPP